MTFKFALRLVAALLPMPLMLALPAGATLRHRPPLSDTPQPLAKPEPQFPVNANWTLREINGRPAGDDPPSFTLDDKYRATGFSGCNTYSMPLYPMRGQKLAAGAIAMTRKQCDKGLMLTEREFLVCLHSVPAWSMDEGDLVIKARATTLRFRRGV